MGLKALRANEGLKEDYIDSIYEGLKNYKMTFRDDTIKHASLEDETEYLQDGDTIGADDINATNKAVNINTGNISTLDKATKELSTAHSNLEKSVKDLHDIKGPYTLVASGWVGNNIDGFSQSYQGEDINWIKSTDCVLCEPYKEGKSFADKVKIINNWTLIIDAVSGDKKITMWATDKPSIDIQFIIKK